MPLRFESYPGHRELSFGVALFVYVGNGVAVLPMAVYVCVPK